MPNDTASSVHSPTFRCSESGEVLGLIGPNGAGKTTLLEAIAGLAVDDLGFSGAVRPCPPPVASSCSTCPTDCAPGKRVCRTRDQFFAAAMANLQHRRMPSASSPVCAAGRRVVESTAAGSCWRWR